MSWIPLLAPKALRDFAATEFKNYVRGLYYKKPKKKSPAKRKTPLKAYSARLNPKGTLVLTIRTRDPKWISREEIAEIAATLGIEERLVYLKVGERGIKISTQAEEDRISLDVANLPW